MIVYNVTISIDAAAEQEWLVWMNTVHIPDVLATGLFMDARISRLLNIEEQGGLTYSIQYTLSSMAQMEEYEKNHAPRLRMETEKKFSGRYAAFRTLMQVVGHHTK